MESEGASMNQFYIGQDVICVDDKVPLMGGAVVKDANLTEGQVYKIRRLEIVCHYVFGEYLGICVEGVDSKFGEPWGVPDCPYKATRFRPLVNDPLASLRNIAADPDGYKPAAPEGPVRGKPVREGAPRKKEVV
jgi:hypothetical protein